MGLRASAAVSALVSACVVVATALTPTPVGAATQPQQWTTYHADTTRDGEDTADGAFGATSAA